MLATAPAFDPPLWSVAPYAALLLAIAVLPLTAPHFWHDLRNQALAVLACALPVAGYLLLHGPEARTELWHGVEEYVSFIVLLGALYVVAGGLVLRGALRAGTRTNALLLGGGAVLTNLIGTTGASMVLIRPVLRVNAHRKSRGHVPIFFIFLVSNLGGLLTPLGDPPLLLGYLRGVPFGWTASLWPEWLGANGLVLAAFVVWDRRAYRREPKPEVEAEVAGHGPPRLAGWGNVPLLLLIIAAVLLRSPAAAGTIGGWLRAAWPAAPDPRLAFPYGELALTGIAVLSLGLTPRGLRAANAFRWDPLLEVAVLFAGIFVAMVPALALLQNHGPKFGLTEPWQYFWATGLLSSVLDNAPTYVCMGTLAAGGGDFGALAAQQPAVLQAISCGAVFMGANTYVGNAPNFMVRVIAEESGYPMPSFFGYLLYSGLILLPVFGVVTVAFFRP
jgi:Na+/H+ antiporter NhaD/arsenite permease-like protein